MIVSEVASRYSKALYEMCEQQKNMDKAFSDLRAIDEILKKNPDIADFLNSPVIKASDKESALKIALENKGLSTEVETFILLLAKKSRINLFHEIVQGFQDKSDFANGVSRGEVKSATVLSPEERSKIENIVEKVTKKKVIMSYQEDQALIGGLTAMVGSFRFDDSLEGHLKRIKDQLKKNH